MVLVEEHTVEQISDITMQEKFLICCFSFKKHFIKPRLSCRSKSTSDHNVGI